MHGVCSHVHERAASRELGVVEPGQLRGIEPSAIGRVVGVAVARVRQLAQLALAQKLLDALHAIGEGLEVAHVDDGVVLADQLDGLPGLVGSGRERFLAEDRFPGRDRGLKHGEVARVFRTDDEGIDILARDGRLDV